MSDPIRIPQPDEVSEREKEDAMGAYLMMFAAWGIGLPLPLLNLIAALIYFMVNRKASRFVAFHAHQALTSQVPVSLLNAGLIGWFVGIALTGFHFVPAFFIALIFVGLVNVADIVYSLIATVKARKGRMYYLPVFGRLAYARYYGPRAAPLARPVEPNRPPEGF